MAIRADDERFEPAVPLFDRELSLLEFNSRVLGEAQDDHCPRG